jgi:hypothetical protein
MLSLSALTVVVQNSFPEVGNGQRRDYLRFQCLKARPPLRLCYQLRQRLSLEGEAGRGEVFPAAVGRVLIRRLLVLIASVRLE